jgi:hypothetical protein
MLWNTNVYYRGHAISYWLRFCAINRKVAGSRPYEVNEFPFFNVPNPPGFTRPWGHSASNRNEYQKEKNNVSLE